jgi:hypothetical protein
MIKMKLSKKNIPYDETHDIQPLIERGIQRLPVMMLEDGTTFTSPTEMNDWIKTQPEG